MSKQDVKKLVYNTLTFSLTTARTDEEELLAGFFDQIAVVTLTGSASIRLNEKTRDALDLTIVRSVGGGPFNKFFLTNAAQADGVLILAVGADASFIVDATPTQQKDLVATNSGVVTTAAWAAIGGFNSFYMGDAEKILIFIGESGGVNGANFRISGSSLGITWQLLGAAIPVAASATAYVVLTDAWRYLLIEVQDLIAASHATVFCSVHKLRA